MAHLKRLLASKHFPISRKKNTFTISPSPGPHGKRECIPLAVLLKEGLKLAEGSREAKKVIAAGELMVDGRIRRNHKHPVGLMDVVQIPKIKKSFRVIAREGRLKLVEIGEDKASWKLCKVKDKTVTKGKKVQVNLHDGRNIIVGKDDYKTGDSLMLSLPDQKVMDHFRLEKGAAVIITGGKYVGTVGKVADIVNVRGVEANKAIVEADGKQYTTLKDYVFVIGKNEPVIQLE